MRLSEADAIKFVTTKLEFCGSLKPDLLVNDPHFLLCIVEGTGDLFESNRSKI